MPPKKSFLLRLPPELWEQLKRWADDDLRSVNAQVEYILRAAINQRRRKLDEETDTPPTEG